MQRRGRLPVLAERAASFPRALVPALRMSRIVRELRICREFTKYDLTTGLVPPVLFVLAAAVHYHLTAGACAVALGKGAVVFTLYIYAFCLSNQIAGVDEDQRNKPDRPLPLGLVPRDGAWSRLVVVLVGYTAVGLWWGIVEWVVLWQAILVLYNQGRWSRHWLAKNALIALGTFVQLGAAWTLVAPMSPLGWRWILIVSLAILVLIPVQDLRDMAGDRLAGRRTFPLAFGATFTRAYLSVGFIALPLATHALLIAPAGATATMADAVLAAIAWVVAFRVAACRSARADHLTYMLFTYWYMAILLSATLVM